MLEVTISEHHALAAQAFEDAARHHRMAAEHAKQSSHEFANMHAHLAATHQAKAVEHARQATLQFESLHG